MGKKNRTEVAPGYVSKASLSTVRVSPRKARLVANLIRGAQVGNALDLLGNCDKKTAPLVKKLLMSAVSSAKLQSSVDIDELYVKSIWVDEKSILYRFMPRAHGRATKIRKRSSSITLHLDEVGAR